MHSRFLAVLPVLFVLFMHISLLQLVAFNHDETGNVTVKCIERERQALLALKRGFQLNDEDWLSSWGDEVKQKECCNWEGVHCSNVTGHVLMLDLHADAYGYVTAAGSISPSLGELHHLNYLDLSYIYFELTPSVPNFVGSLTLLRHLSLSICGFQGKIPHELGNLIFLEYLDLGGNNLNGEIPRQFSNLSVLRYMDLGDNSFNTTMPSQLGNLLSLEYLDLSSNYFIGTIPHHFGNLSNLQYLDCSYQSAPLRSDLQWVSHLSSLRHLSLGEVNLSRVNSWQQLVSGLSHLQYLDFGGCNLPDSLPSSLSYTANFSTSLSSVDLSSNNLTNLSIMLPWLMNSTSSLAILSLSDNGLKGTIPEAFGNLSSLEKLDLATNMLGGQIPISLFHICSLRELDLSANRLTGQFHQFVRAFSRCAHKPLQVLYMGRNEITGTVPADISRLSSLRELQLDSNGLNGTLNEGIGQLSNLMRLSLGNNSFEGLISEAHFSKLSKLIHLDLSHNALVFNVSTAWDPPFNLIYILLTSCTLGPSFPRWLQTQEMIRSLDISCAKISDAVPNWFWDLLSNTRELNLSHNHLRGKIGGSPLEYPDFHQVDLSSNLFEGPIPPFLSRTYNLVLSNNMFSTANLLLCVNTSTYMEFLDLSINYLKGQLPECWINCHSLVFLDLSDNYFHGNIPRSMGSLRDIEALHLGGNNFSGEIPLSLINCTRLQVFDVAQNNLSGPLPSWFGDHLSYLLILSLHSNNFHGTMPLSICHLHELYLLDLSLNNFSGSIPKCISNFSAMAGQAKSEATISHRGERFIGYNRGYDYTIDRDDSATLIWKGKMSRYRSTLGLLRSIDFSSNRLIGEIPSEITSLVDLISLNISRNMLSGEIPPTIGQLKSLDFLDLSRNQLSGRIPSQLSQIDRLSVLDLSYNNLSGEIPLGTQLQTRDASAFIGNPELCGAPLNRTCPIHGHQIDGNHAYDEQFFTEGFYIAMAIGFITGFWGVCCSLILKKSWRYAYFKFLNDVYDKLYVLAAIKIAKLKRIGS